MRVTDLDRDMSSVFPLGISPDSTFLYERMADATRRALRVDSGDHVLDSAAGLGEDGRLLAERGIRATNVEPSRRMTELGPTVFAKRGLATSPLSSRVRAWSESLPFRSAVFDASFCKGSVDHFDDPERCMAELARVTRSGGRVVLAVVNMDSLGCRIGRVRDRIRLRSRRLRPGRRHSDVPPDHFTRYDSGLLRRQAQRHIAIEEWTGISMLWGVESWMTFLGRVPPVVAQIALRTADWMARRFPAAADLIVVAGRPLR